MFARTASVGAPCVPLLSTHTFLRHKIRIGALQAGRHDRLMVIDGDMILGCGLDDLAIMANARLTFIPLQAVDGTDDRRHIARLDDIDTMHSMVGVGFIQHLLVIGCVSAGLVMPDDLHTQTVCQSAQIVHIPVVIRFGEREMLPVLPTFVPSLRQHGFDTMFLGETHVPLHILCRSTVDRSLFPGHGLDMHAPPDTHEFHRFDPRGVVQSAGFVEVKHDARSHHLRQRLREDDHAPRCGERRGDIRLDGQRAHV